MLLIGNGRIVTQDKNRPYIENGCLAIEKDKIVEVGELNELKEKYPKARFVDAKGKVIMPGLINTHMHIYSSFARGMAVSGSTENFMKILENLWWKVDKALTIEDTKYSALVTYIDCIKNGCTTVIDHHASPYFIKDSLFTIGNAAKELGIRTSLCYEVSDRDGQKIAEDGIQENVNFIKYANKEKDDMLKGMFGLHAAFTLSNNTLDKCREAVDGLNAGFHAHTAEGIEDLHYNLKNHGKRVVERLKDFDILGEKTIAVHCIHVNERELDLIKESNTAVVHNPESNMGNAVGCSPVIHMMNKGIVVGLGTDGYTSDMFESFKAANILHKHNLCRPDVAWEEVPKMLFENNVDIAKRQFGCDVGVIKENAKADIVIVDYIPHTPMNENNYNAHILFGMSGRSVETTIINGKIIMENRELIGIDEEKIFAKARNLSEKLWNRI